MGYIENETFDRVATNVYITAMVFTLTILVLSSLANLRREVQSIYFYYYSARNQEQGVNFLKLRTVLITGVTDMDTKGRQLETEVTNTFKTHAVYGKLYGQIFLKDFRKYLGLESQKKSLEFYRGVVSHFKINKLSKKLLGKSVNDEGEYNLAQARLDEKIDSLEERPGNSGYAFACFSSFGAVKKFKQSHRGYYKQLPNKQKSQHLR